MPIEVIDQDRSSSCSWWWRALAPVITWVERKQSAVMQDRIGANRADIAGITVLGLLHPLADVLKLLTKEDVVPTGANRVHAPARADHRRRSRR